MKAAFFHETGPPEVIQYGDLPTPEPKTGEVLVKVAAVAVNPIDTYIRAGKVAMDLPKPFIIGCDLAGTVQAVGAGTHRFQPGDRVWGSNQGLLGRQGTFAEFACVDERWLYPTPDKVSDEAAAAVALVGITAHLGLVSRGQLRPGETVFVNGGSGGVGSTVIQMAKALGAAKVIATAGSDDKLALCRSLGADHAINYKTEDVAAKIKEAAPQGVDLWWEATREANFDLAVPLMAARGRYILMAGREARPEFPVGPFYVKGLSLHGFAMFAESDGTQRQCAEDINRWLAEGKLQARIDRRMPLREAAAAHRLQEENTLGMAGTLAGKIVLAPA